MSSIFCGNFTEEFEEENAKQAEAYTNNAYDAQRSKDICKQTSNKDRYKCRDIDHHIERAKDLAAKTIS